MVRFSLSSEQNIALDIFDPQGRKVRSLLQGSLPAGAREVEWNGRDDSGRRAESGVYYVRLQAGRNLRVRSVTLLR